MGRRIPLLLAALLVLQLFACDKPSQARDSGRSGIARGARQAVGRVVSLTPSATAILNALGTIDLLVGRDQFSVEPKSIRALPVVGDFSSPNVEAIAALTPDLVLLDASQEKTRLALEMLQIQTLSLKMHRLADVSQGLRSVGNAIGRPARAEQVILELQLALQRITEKAAARGSHPKVLLIIDRSPDGLRNLVAAGPNTYLGELLTMVGAVNVLAGTRVLYPQLGAEQVLRAAPDVIIDLSQGQGSEAAYQVVAEVPAVANHRVYLLREPSLRAPSPLAAQGLERLFALTAL